MACSTSSFRPLLRGDIRPGAVIGRRFTVHTARGLLITNGVQIGDDVMVNNGVCLVYRANNRGGGVPKVGSDVRLGIGCKVLGRRDGRQPW